jgi:hypothetical protein
MRAKMIARNETVHATRISTIHAYQDEGSIEEVMIFDNQTGFGDSQCSELNGRIVPIEEARDLIDSEHANGTRAFAPVVA